MKGKTKTILTVLIAILVFATAVVGTVTFLKDDGEASAAEEGVGNVLPNTGSDDEQTNPDGEQNPAEDLEGEENPGEQPSEGETGDAEEGTTGEGETTTQGTTGNQGTTVGGQLEPESTTIEQERLVSTTLNWSSISLNSTIGDTGINYTNLAYTIKYYQVVSEEEFNLLNTETGIAEYASTVAVTEEQIKENCPVGYKLDETSALSVVISENVEANLIEVYYIKDDSQTKEITYTVKHYVEEEYQVEDDFTETKTVWVNETEIPVTYELDEDKYVGYMLSSEDLTETATDGTEFTVKYVRDDSQTKEITYTVKHYVEEEYQAEDDFTETKTVWVNDTTIPVTYVLDEDKYVGYMLSSEDLTETAIDGTEFTVKYVRDDSQTKEITYTVKHYVEEEYQAEDDFTETKTVWVNETEIPVTYELDEDKYVGYMLSSEDLTETATDGTEFTVKYVRDDSQTKEITYTVKHYVEEEYQAEDDFTETKTVWVNDTTIPVTYELDENKYVGYMLSSEDLTETATDGTEFTVKYVRDDSQTKEITYTVKHYVEEEYQAEDDFTETKTVWVNETEIPVTYELDEDKYVGYMLSSEDLTETATDGTEFTVKYVRDDSQTKEITYTVKHYVEEEYQAEDDFTETKTVWVNETEIPVTYVLDEDKYVGYMLSSENLTETATDGTEFTVKYVRDDSQTKEITYTVKHYVEEEYQAEDDFTETKTVWVNETTIPVTYKLDANKYVGYKLSENDLTQTAENGTEFTVKYIKDDSQTKEITYTVKHYVDEVYQDKDDFTETKTVWVNETTIPVTYKLDANKYVGYKLSENDLTQTAENGTEFTVKYVRDNSQTKEITYTVKHYVAGEYQENDDFTETKTVWVNETTIPVTYKLDANKYVGYKLSENDLTEIAENGKVFTVKYVRDDSQTKEITYTVKHYIEDAYQAEDDFTETKTVWVNDTVIPVTYELDDDKYVGYKLAENDLTETAENGTVFTVKYVKDDSQTKEITYTVKHYIENAYQAEDDFTETKTVWVNDTVIPVTYELDANKYVGYKLAENDLTETAENGKVFTVKYVKDYSQTKEITYTVKHYVAGEYQENDDFTETKTVWVNDTVIPVTYELDDDKYVGYKLSENDLTQTAKNGTEFTVKYVRDDLQQKDLSYTVEYYKDGNKVTEDCYSVPAKVWVNAPDTITVGTVDTSSTKYTGYRLSEKNTFKLNDEIIDAIPETVANGDVIKVFYEKDTFEYTVEYYYENASGEFVGPDEIASYTKSAKYQDVVTYLPKDQNGTYVFFKVESAGVEGEANLTVTEKTENNIIKVYYERNSYDYKVVYYKDGINGTKLGETAVKEQKLGTVMNSDLVTVDFGAEWLNKYKPQVGYQDGTVVEYITIQANDNNVIQVVYAPRTDIEYSVEYYFNNELDTTGKNYSETTTFGETIKLEDITDYSNNGEWTLESSNLPFEIVAVTGNVIRVYYVKPEITVEKTRIVNTNRTEGAANTVEPGETITYTITATNNGYKEGTVTIADTVPTGTTLTGNITVTGYTKSTVTPGELEAGIELTVQANGGTASVTFTVTVTANVNNNIVNTPTVNGTEDTENTVTNPVEKTVSVKAKSDNSTITNSNIVIVLDTSGSMDWGSEPCNENHNHSKNGCDYDRNTGKWCTGEPRIDVAKKVINGFIDKMDLPETQTTNSCAVTVVEFSDIPTVIGTADTASEATTLKNNVDNFGTGGGTYMADGLQKAKTELEKLISVRPNNKNIVIFVSDGEPSSTSGLTDAANALKGVSNTTVYTVAFGADISILKDTIASSTDKYYTTTTSGSLSGIFSDVNADITGTAVPTQSVDGLIELTGVYADDKHPIEITVNTTPLSDITVLPTDDSGKVIFKDGKYYLNLSEFNATDSVTIEYFAE